MTVAEIQTEVVIAGKIALGISIVTSGQPETSVTAKLTMDTTLRAMEQVIH
jgi:hypothetical protein